MISKKDSIWIDLYNSLYFISSKYDDIASLESPVFEPFDELDTSFLNGFKLQNIYFYHKNKWINEKQLEQLIEFRTFIDSLDDKLWNKYDFDNNNLWIQARNWAINILKELKEERRGWDSTGEEIVFLED